MQNGLDIDRGGILPHRKRSEVPALFSQFFEIQDHAVANPFRVGHNGVSATAYEIGSDTVIVFDDGRNRLNVASIDGDLSPVLFRCRIAVIFPDVRQSILAD